MAIGLNPALQKLLNFQKFTPGQVNRAEMISYNSGGKAANFAKASINHGTKAVIYQFSGGSSGEKYCKILNLEKLPYVNQETKVETRTCSTLMSNTFTGVTEIIEPSGTILETEAKNLLAHIICEMPQYQGVALCGTFPPGIKAKFYAKIIHQAVKKNIPSLLDACVNVETVLKEGPEILKINLDELKKLSRKRKAETAAVNIFTKYPVKIIAITDGPNSAHLFLRKDTDTKKAKVTHYQYSIPQMKRIINPIGAGDTVSAILLSEYIAGTPLHEAFKLALAAGSASCLTHQNAVFDAKFAKRLAAREIKLTEK